MSGCFFLKHGVQGCKRYYVQTLLDTCV